MATKTGFTSTTPSHLQLDAGVLCTGYTSGAVSGIIAATRGGGSITIAPEMHQAAVDGAPTYTVGLERKDGVNARLSFTAVEFTETSFKTALGAGATLTTTTHKLTGQRKVAAADYSDVYWVGSLASGGDVVIKLSNALSLGGLNMSVTDKGEGTYSMELVAHYSASDLDKDPWEIIFPTGTGSGG